MVFFVVISKRLQIFGSNTGDQKSHSEQIQHESFRKNKLDFKLRKTNTCGKTILKRKNWVCIG